MLASLLPGLREVRAPLAAGFVWLVALWFLLEPWWPEGDTHGVIGSANRLLANLGLLGQGVVVSFTAYLIGAFSVLLFSGPLLGTLRTSVDGGGRLDGLSPLGRASLAQVAKDGRQRLEQALTLSGLHVGNVLDETSPVEGPERWGRHGQPWWRRWVRGGEPDPMPEALSAPSLPEEEAEREIARRVLRDLPAVADAQLLGKETDVFSAVDRNQAEVDFRVALVPAVSGLALSLAIVSVLDQPLVAPFCILVGGLAAMGLMRDAARQRRAANELVLSLMEHGRIQAPAVLRAESAALTAADQAPSRILARQGEAAARAIRHYMVAVEQFGDSSVFRGVPHAVESSEKAHEESRKLEQLMSRYESRPRRGPLAGEVLKPLDEALATVRDASAQIDTAEGKYLVGEPARLPDPEASEGARAEALRRTNDRLAACQRQAAEAFDEFVRRVRVAVSQAAADDAVRGAITGEPGVVGTGEPPTGERERSP